MLSLQGDCLEKPCLRHSSGAPLGDRLSMRFSGQGLGLADFSALDNYIFFWHVLVET